MTDVTKPKANEHIYLSYFYIFYNLTNIYGVSITLQIKKVAQRNT